jgi:D-glucosaminate-6-phosphate ammonia-lyase
MSETLLDLKQVINASGTMTALGAAAANQEAIDAAAAILIRAVEMPELHRAASLAIARATGAEAGCVTACAGAGISVAVAATMTGDDLARIERLPDTSGLKGEVILQKGHNCHFSGEIAQMVRLAGASVVEIGTVNRAMGYQLEGALSERTAAALYVVSHQTSQNGMIGLKEFCTICHARGVPVIVDAAAEYDLHGFLARGADLAIYSAHKVLGGLTAGIIAGRENLVRACCLQECGIGRAMKVGKEGVASTIAVLQRWQVLDKEALWRQENARAEHAAGILQEIAGLAVNLEADPTGNPVTRVRIKVDAAQTGMDAGSLSLSLAAGNPAVYVRAHDIDPDSILLDPCNLSDADMNHVCRCIAKSVATSRSGIVPAG